MRLSLAIFQQCGDLPPKADGIKKFVAADCNLQSGRELEGLFRPFYYWKNVLPESIILGDEEDATTIFFLCVCVQTLALQLYIYRNFFILYLGSRKVLEQNKSFKPKRRSIPESRKKERLTDIGMLLQYMNNLLSDLFLE